MHLLLDPPLSECERTTTEALAQEMAACLRRLRERLAAGHREGVQAEAGQLRFLARQLEEGLE